MSVDPIELIEQAELRIHQELVNLTDLTHNEIVQLQISINEEINRLHTALRAHDQRSGLRGRGNSFIMNRLERMSDQMDGSVRDIGRLVTVTDRLDASIDTMNATLASLTSAVTGLQTSNEKLNSSADHLQVTTSRLDATIAGLDDRIDARLWKHTWAVLGGVVAIAGTAAGVFAVFT